MGTTVTIDDYASRLFQSDTPRGSTPTGNIYFDTDAGNLQIITASEQATFVNGGQTITNTLTTLDGVTFQALYKFEKDRRQVNAEPQKLQQWKRFMDAIDSNSMSFRFINGRKCLTDRVKIRQSGWTEYAAAGGGNTLIDRVYHGCYALNDIQNSSRPYYALTTATDEAAFQAATWTNFVREGDINEAIQVYGSTANGDSLAGNFDFRAYILTLRLRTWGYDFTETSSVAASVKPKGFKGGYGIGEILNASNTYALADVFGAARVAPFTGLSLEKLASPQTVTGFNEGPGAFTWVLRNTLGATAAQCAAYLDAVALQDSDVDVGSGVYNGRKGRVWYSRNAAAKIVTASIGGAGLLIDGLSGVEKQNVVQTTDSGVTRTYPFYPTIQINVGTIAPTDPQAWYRVLHLDGDGVYDFNTANAVTVKDASGADVAGNVAAKALNGIISFTFDYDNNNQAGLVAGTDKPIVVLVGGNGIATEAIAFAVITRSTVVNVVCAPVAEANT